MNKSVRTGVMATKVGMTRYYDSDGDNVSATILKVNDCLVVGSGENENGSFFVRVGYGKVGPNGLNKSVKSLYLKNDLDLRKNIKSFSVTSDAVIDTGKVLDANHYCVNQYIDVCSFSKGKGFSGGMKRHGFLGMEATHGVSKAHRSHGSTGQCQDPGKVFKGKKMAGQYGFKRVTVQGLQILDIDADLNLIVVRGAVPGFKGCDVTIVDSVKRSLFLKAPFPCVV